jgi:hypothetical protein
VRTLVSMVLPVLLCVARGMPARADDIIIPLPAADEQRITAQLGAGVVGQAVPSTPIEDASVYFPLQQKALAYQVTAGTNAGKTQTLHVARKSRPNGTPAWRFQLSPTLAAFIRQTPAATS